MVGEGKGDYRRRWLGNSTGRERKGLGSTVVRVWKEAETVVRGGDTSWAVNDGRGRGAMVVGLKGRVWWCLGWWFWWVEGGREK